MALALRCQICVPRRSSGDGLCQSASAPVTQRVPAVDKFARLTAYLPGMDFYYWLFSESAGSKLVVPMGQSLPFTVAGQPLLIKNHGSFQGTGCDTDSDWAFTVIGQ